MLGVGRKGLNWEGGRTDAVVELGGWAQGRGGWTRRVGARTRWLSWEGRRPDASGCAHKCCRKHDPADDSHLETTMELLQLFKAYFCQVYDAYKSYLFIMVYGQIFVDGTWWELTVNNTCKANCLFLNQLYFSKFMNLELKSRSGCLVRNKSWSIGEPDARPKARNILYTLSHFGSSFNLWH